MNKKKWILSLSFLGIFSVLLISSDLFGPQKTAEAACGASTSSCETCHEVQGEDPVSKNGDWHVQHAFGDFCQACHLGVSTENDKTAAHEGLVVKPLSQPDQSCATCHPADLDARVMKYGGSATSTEASSGDATPSVAATQVPPGGDSNNKFIEGKTPLLAWIIGIVDVLILLALVVLILKWKKGFWIWFLFKGKK